MKSIIPSILTILLVTISFAFTSQNNDGLDVVYGVSDDDPSSIELKLSKDYTFTYQDFSDPDHKIAVQGTYLLKKKKVVLKANNEQTEFHDKWRFVDNGMAAKSRKGLAFYTLRKIE